MPHLEITEIVLVHFNIVYNKYQHDSRFFYTSVSNKSFSQLFTIKFISLKTFNSGSSYIELWLTDKISPPLGIEDQIKINLIITGCIACKLRYSIEPIDQIFVRGY